MAFSTLHTNLTLLSLHRSTKPTTTTVSYAPIRCGPRDNRGPLQKGRILSVESIQAIQTLKRANRTNPSSLPTVATTTLSRLIKSDLLATLRELLRQDQCTLAFHALSVVRSEYQPDLGLYADLISALARNKLTDEIDSVVEDLIKEGGIQCGQDYRGLVRVLRVVIAAGRRESTVRIYRAMRESGWGDTWQGDEYMVKVLSKGLRRMGEVELADEICKDFGHLLRAVIVDLRN